jgi:predicted GNAT family N-acyltransferase
MPEDLSIGKIEAHQTWKLRRQVMWPQRDIDYVKLTDDAAGLHYGLFIQDRLISVISLFFTDDAVQFRKFATCCKHQKQGYGTRLLRHAIEEAKNRKAARIWCNARKDAVGFYEKFGLTEVGADFERDGVRYIKMSRDLS